MNSTIKNILAVIVGFIVGSAVNMGIIMISHQIIAYPEGMIIGDMDSLKEYLPQFEMKHFIMPFLAHALGVFVGAFVIVKIAASRQLMLALLLGAFFMIGGIKMVIDIPGTPVEFAAVDILGAYLPMAWLAHKIGRSKK